jgi:hypothetical protein
VEGLGERVGVLARGRGGAAVGIEGVGLGRGVRERERWSWSWRRGPKFGLDGEMPLTGRVESYHVDVDLWSWLSDQVAGCTSPPYLLDLPFRTVDFFVFCSQVNHPRQVGFATPWASAIRS